MTITEPLLSKPCWKKLNTALHSPWHLQTSVAVTCAQCETPLICENNTDLPVMVQAQVLLKDNGHSSHTLLLTAWLEKCT